MNTVDSLLPSLSQKISQIQALIPKKDKRILLSLAKQVSNGLFLTENQAKLMVKILNENLKPVSSIVPDVETVIFENLWSKEFRVVQKVRKIGFDDEYPNSFIVEFNFNTRLKEKISKISSKIEGHIATKGAKYIIYLNECNIDTVVSTFIKDDFEIDQKIMDFYQEIENIKKSSTNPFEIFSTSHEKMKRAVTSAVGDIEHKNILLLQDRKIRFQYEICEKTGENSLCAKIAQRPDRRVFANSQEINFVDLVRSLQELNRLPALIIFDGHSASKDKKVLKLLENAISSLNLGSEVGIYFRYDKDSDTENFNKEIAVLSYNKTLGSNTVIAGISNNKLPKFMVKTGWKPQTVISFTNGFRSNKTSVYCSDVDLIIYYSNTPPLGESIHALV